MLAPPSIAVHQLAKHLPAFHAQYPLVTLDLTAPGPIEAIDENFDLSILSVRKPLDGDFVARLLARSEVIICASPEYLDKHGRPQHPRELGQFNALIPPNADVMRGVTLYRGLWGDDEPGGESYTFVREQRPLLMTSNVDVTYAAALAGLGIGGLPSFVIEDALQENALERVLPEWRLFSTTIWAAMPTRKHMPARTRAFLDFLIGIFGGEDRDPWLAAAGCETTYREAA